MLSRELDLNGAVVLSANLGRKNGGSRRRHKSVRVVGRNMGGHSAAISGRISGTDLNEARERFSVGVGN